LEKDFGVPADVYSITSFSELRKNALDIERWNLLHPTETQKQTYVRQALGEREGPFVAATDYMKTVPDQIRQWVPGRYAVLGTDGFGRSDSRAELRRFFEVNRHYVVIAALKALADDGKIDMHTVTKAMSAFGIDPEKPNPLTV
jgi:pyruvate dehydrogenase E1 component